jgi:hypothetical protein
MVRPTHWGGLMVPIHGYPGAPLRSNQSLPREALPLRASASAGAFFRLASCSRGTVTSADS